MALNAKQQRFVQEYLLDLNATQAAIRAGYSEKTAKQIGSRLLTNVDVAAAVEAQQTKRAEAAELSAEWVIERIRENAMRALQAEPVYDREGKPTGEYTYQGSVANRALELLGKHMGMFSDNLNIRQPDGPLQVNVTHKVVRPSGN